MRKNTKNNGFPGNICQYFPSWIFAFTKFDDKKTFRNSEGFDFILLRIVSSS
ncbi:hypothetical protein DEU40_10517 [Chryseobacterium sp. AG844]|nr:hypothetical protein DEU40_10517 [Chryseobacterium sp. AG844]